MANRFSMDSESFFLSSASVIAADICDLGMPHALQTAREFWQSSMPEKLSSYYTQSNKAAAAATIQACGPKDVVTLDPDDIMGAQVIY